MIVKNNHSVLIPKINGVYGECNFKSFGTVEILIDTIAPKIKTAVPIKKLKKIIHSAGSISFIVTDNLSGIGKYNLYVNDKWVVAEYDAKSNLITYDIPEETPEGVSVFLLVVRDKVENTRTFKLSLLR